MTIEEYKNAIYRLRGKQLHRFSAMRTKFSSKQGLKRPSFVLNMADDSLILLENVLRLYITAI